MTVEPPNSAGSSKAAPVVAYFFLDVLAVVERYASGGNRWVSLYDAAKHLARKLGFEIDEARSCVREAMKRDELAAWGVDRNGARARLEGLDIAEDTVVNWDEDRIGRFTCVEVEQAGLNAIVNINARESAASEAQAEPYETEYMKIIRETPVELGITRKNQPLKKVVEAHVRKKTIGGQPLSERTVSAIASFVRLPERRRGSAFRSR